jgi:hypothetical protein
MSNDLFRRAMSVGAIEILGDPTLRAPESDAPNRVRYTDDDWRNSDQILFGIGESTGGVTVRAGGTALLSQQVSTPFKALRLVAPSTLAPGLFIESLKIGPTELVDGDPVFLEALTEVSLANLISFPTAQTSQSIAVRVRNTTAADVDEFSIALLGIRLRN